MLLAAALRSLASLLSKQHQKFVTRGHYNLATMSLKFREQITKFQGMVLNAAGAGTPGSSSAERHELSNRRSEGKVRSEDK
jgi:hypothetical protein